MTQALVDVVIPVHREERPVERAVASVVDGSGLARAIVVCHNIEKSLFERRLAPFGTAVRLVVHRDGIPSPAGPLNAGLSAGRSEWVSCMGSDDWFEPGSPEAWACHLRHRDPDILLLPVLDKRNGETDVPAVRGGRTEDLDVVKDRLCYRTGPLFLVRRDLLNDHSIHMTEGLRTGEDLAYSSHALLFSTRTDLLGPGSPRYVEGADGDDRVTSLPFSLAELLQPPCRLAGYAWVKELPERKLDALGVRVVRRSILPALLAHAADLTSEDVELATEVLASWLSLSPGARRPLSIVEDRVVRGLARGADVDDVRRTVRALTGAPRWQKVLTAEPRGILDPEARLRHLSATRRLRREWSSAERSGRNK